MSLDRRIILGVLSLLDRLYASQCPSLCLFLKFQLCANKNFYPFHNQSLISNCRPPWCRSILFTQVNFLLVCYHDFDHILRPNLTLRSAQNVFILQKCAVWVCRNLLWFDRSALTCHRVYESCCGSFQVQRDRYTKRWEPPLTWYFLFIDMFHRLFIQCLGRLLAF